MPNDTLEVVARLTVSGMIVIIATGCLTFVVGMIALWLFGEPPSRMDD